MSITDERAREVLNRAKDRAAARAATGEISIEGSIYDGMDACLVRGGQTIAHVMKYADAVEIAALAREVSAPKEDAQADGVASGWIVANGAGDRWRTWSDGNPEWTADRNAATRYARREDAEAVHREDEDAWLIQRFTDRCTVPPTGWTCSREPGHDGPCAASPTAPKAAPETGEVERNLTAQRQTIEACAKIAETMGWEWGGDADDSPAGNAGKEIAKAIRALRANLAAASPPAPSPSLSVEAMREALETLEAACDDVAATRSPETYLRMIDVDKATPAMLALDEARANARTLLAALSPSKQEIERAANSIEGEVQRLRDAMESASPYVQWYQNHSADEIGKVEAQELLDEIAALSKDSDHG